MFKTTIVGLVSGRGLRHFLAHFPRLAQPQRRLQYNRLSLPFNFVSERINSNGREGVLLPRLVLTGHRGRTKSTPYFHHRHSHHTGLGNSAKNGYQVLQNACRRAKIVIKFYKRCAATNTRLTQVFKRIYKRKLLSFTKNG